MLIRTGQTDGHLHTHEQDAAFTDPFEGHFHAILSKGFETGCAMTIGSISSDDDHVHDLPSRMAQEIPKRW